MKKIFTLLAVAMMSLAMVSCGGGQTPLEKAEDLVEQMEKALQDKDAEALKEIAAEVEALEIDEDTLTEEEQQKLEELGQRILAVMFGSMGLE